MLPGGRTAHSRLKIPINLDSTSVFNIKVQSQLAELIRQTDLIIWDEAPMISKYAFEAMDRSFKDIMRSINPKFEQLPFGNKVIVWNYFRTIKLKINMRVLRSQSNSTKEFAEYLLAVGEGRVQTIYHEYEEDYIQLPQEMVVKSTPEDFVNIVYPNLQGNRSIFIFIIFV